MRKQTLNFWNLFHNFMHKIEANIGLRSRWKVFPLHIAYFHVMNILIIIIHGKYLFRVSVLVNNRNDVEFYQSVHYFSIRNAKQIDKLMAIVTMTIAKWSRHAWHFKYSNIKFEDYCILQNIKHSFKTVTRTSIN